MKEPCVTIGYSHCDKCGNIPGGPIWMLHWLPEGYGPSMNDRILGVFFDTGGEWAEHSPGPNFKVPALLEAVKDAIERFMKENPDAALGGHFQYPIWKSGLSKEST